MHLVVFVVDSYDKHSSNPRKAMMQKSGNFAFTQAAVSISWTRLLLLFSHSSFAYKAKTVVYWQTQQKLKITYLHIHTLI